MSCNNFTRPILGTGVQKTIVTSPAKSLADLGISLDPETREVALSFEGDPMTPEIIARYWDEGSTPTSSVGRPIQNNDELRFTLEQAIQLKLIAVTSSRLVNITEYGVETFI